MITKGVYFKACEYTNEKTMEELEHMLIRDVPDRMLALLFFNRIKEKGFGVEIRDYSNRLETDEDFDSTNITIQLKDSLNKTFMSVDFLGDNFYRISGTDSTGWYGDEVNLKKY